jgi:hypothetical protein
VRGTPDPGRLFLFVAGGLAAFAGLEALLEIAGRSDEEAPQTAFPFAGALNFVAVGGALGASVGLAHAVESGVAWLVVPFAATAAYMLLVAAQVLAVAKLRRR